MRQRSAWFIPGVLAGGTLVVALAGFLQYRSKIGAYRGLESLFAGDKFGVTKMGEGMLNSILTTMMVGTMVLVTVLLVAYLTRNVVAGVAMIGLSLGVLGAFGSLLANYIMAHPVVLKSVPAAAGTHFGQWRYASGDALLPGVVGLLIGLYLGRRAADRELREQNAPVILSQAEREARDAELTQREERARVNRERLARGLAPLSPDEPLPPSPTGAPAAAPVAAPTAAPAPVAATPPSIPAPAPPDRSHQSPPSDAPSPAPSLVGDPAGAGDASPTPARRSIICRKCGSSNAPIRDRCLNCGGPLSLEGAR